MSARAAICLDANAGLAPVAPVRERLGEVLLRLHNPSSTHALGRETRSLIVRARQEVTTSLAALLPGISDEDWVHTSGGTESLQGALRAILSHSEASVWLASAVEHKASLSFIEDWEHRHPGRCHFLPMDESGRVDPARVGEQISRLRSQGILERGVPFVASLIWVNNETGVIQHGLGELCSQLKSEGALILLDGSQAWSRQHSFAQPSLPFSMVDFFVASGHKLGALPGTGVLAYSRSGRRILTQFPVWRGSQQRALRGGTENALGCWSLGAAAANPLWASHKIIRQWRDELEHRITQRISGVRVNGIAAERVFNTLSVSFEGLVSGAAPSLADRLDLEGFAVSSGSACSSGLAKPSHVLRAIGHPEELARASLRLSLPPDFDPATGIEPFVEVLCKVVARLRTQGAA